MAHPRPALFEQATQLHNEGKHEEALRIYWQIYRKQAHAPAAVRIIRIYEEAKAAVAASITLHMALKDFPDDFMLNHMLAMESQRRGDFDSYHGAVVRMAKTAESHTIDLERPLFWPFITSAVDFKGKYLFISGAARSGTTALGQLLNLSPEVLLFVERYPGFYGYSKALFDRERLTALQGHPHEKLNRELLERYRKVRFIGDKRPNFAFSLRATLDRFSPDEMRIVHIIRNPRDVGLSFEKRAANERDKWPSDRGFAVAIEEINWNNREILLALQRGQWAKSIRIVDYTEFWNEMRHARALFEWLGLSFPAGAEPYMKAMYEEAKIIAAKDRPLSADQERLLQRHDRSAYERLLRHAAAQDISVGTGLADHR